MDPDARRYHRDCQNAITKLRCRCTKRRASASGDPPQDHRRSHHPDGTEIKDGHRPRWLEEQSQALKRSDDRALFSLDVEPLADIDTDTDKAETAAARQPGSARTGEPRNVLTETWVVAVSLSSGCAGWPPGVGQHGEFTGQQGGSPWVALRRAFTFAGFRVHDPRIWRSTSQECSSFL